MVMKENASELQNEVKTPTEKLTSNKKGNDSDSDEEKKKHSFPLMPQNRMVLVSAVKTQLSWGWEVGS